MRVPFLDLGAATDELRAPLQVAVDRVLASGRYLFGPELDEFEDAFAAQMIDRVCTRDARLGSQVA
jgi:dTDP-4-amino-4,6-dideoxygalactose transaminase